jgi:hypothetical protein
VQYNNQVFFSLQDQILMNEKQKMSKCCEILQKKRFIIQRGNFNWNKIHNLDIGDFCKKSRNRSIFVFSCPHFGAYGFCISPPGSAQAPLTFFFFNVRVCEVTPRLKGHFARNTTHYLFPEYFQKLHAKKIKNKFIS